MRRLTLYLLLALFALSLSIARSARAQVTTGDILGTVTDTSGAVVPKAMVVVENEGTHITRTAVTANDGNYTVTLLNPGTYSVTITAAGFKAFKEQSINLLAGSRIRVNAALTVGEVSQTVTVESQATALQTDSAVVASTITQEQTKQLPLNGRNFVQLVQLSPGVTPGNQGGLVSGAQLDDHRQSAEMSINGQSDNLNNEMIDGADNNERLIGTITVRPSVESIEEVQIQSNDYSADVSRTGGGVVNIITKSGTNAFHGSLFEYFRNDALNSYTYNFGKNLPKAELRWNQFGGSIDGPIRKNKAFFFGDYEGYREVQGQAPVTLEVPSAFELENPGNFSDMPCSEYPQNCATFGSGPIDHAGLAYFELMPHPNSTIRGLPAYTGSGTRTQNSNDFDARVDYHFNASNSMYGRFIYNHVFTTSNSGGGGAFFPKAPLVGTNLTVVPDGGYNSLDLDDDAMANYTHIFSENLVMDLMASYSFTHNDSFGPNTGLNPNEALGQPNVDTPIDNGTALQSISISTTGDAFGDLTFQPLVDHDNTFQYKGDITYTHGAHVFKFGSSLIRRQLTSVQSAIAGGRPLFHTYADLLQGQYTTMSLPRAQELDAPHLRAWEIGVYGEDNWRVNSHLNLNLGLRYDVYTPYTEILNRISTWDPATESLLVAGQNGVSASAGVQTDYRSGIEPRIGFNWNINDTTVVRGGFGISSDPPNNTSSANMKNIPFVSSVNCSFQTCGLYAQGLPPLDPGTLQTPGVTLDGVDPQFRDSYFEQFNLMMQKQIGANVATIGYVGLLGRRGPTDIPDLNLPGPNTCGADPACYNPLRPYFAKYPDLSTVQLFEDRGVSSYNALQTSYSRRLTRGLAINANYTFARNLSDIGGLTSTGGGGWGLQPARLRQVDYGNNFLDIRNALNVTGMYDLPFGKTAHGWEGAAIKGWEYNLILVWVSGLPYTVTNANCASGAEPGCTDRPNVTGNITVSNPNVSEFFNTAAFTRQATGSFGDEVINPLHGPHFRHADMSLNKTFVLREPWTMQFRAEAFNISNTANFAQPNAALGSGTFGTITAMNAGYTPRVFQFALRLAF